MTNRAQRGNPDDELLSEWRGSIDHTVVLFGGSPHRRHEVVSQLGRALDITVVGTLSEEAGMTVLEELGETVSLVLVGGQYTSEQRERIRSYVASMLPGRSTSEPGNQYAYSNENIIADVAAKLGVSP